MDAATDQIRAIIDLLEGTKSDHQLLNTAQDLPPGPSPLSFDGLMVRYDAWKAKRKSPEMRAKRHFSLSNQKHEAITFLAKKISLLAAEQKTQKTTELKNHLFARLHLKRANNAITAVAVEVSAVAFFVTTLCPISAPATFVIFSLIVISSTGAGFYLKYRERQLNKELEALTERVFADLLEQFGKTQWELASEEKPLSQEELEAGKVQLAEGKERLLTEEEKEAGHILLKKERIARKKKLDSFLESIPQDQQPGQRPKLSYRF